MNPESPKEQAELSLLLREAVEPVPIETVDWQRLHQRIMRDAESRFQARALPGGWLMVTASWSRRVITLSAAAVLAIVMLLTMIPYERTLEVASRDDDTSMLQAALGDPEAQRAVIDAATDTEWLLAESLLGR